MSGHRKVPGNYEGRTEAHVHNLKHLVDFGPDHSESVAAPQETGEAGDRLKRLVKQLEDLNKRVDKLTQRY